MMGFLDKVLGGNVLFYPGCMMRFVLHDVRRNYEEILRKCGTDFIELKNLEVCCGSPVRNAGYLDYFETLAKKNFEVFRPHRVKKVITACPACFKTFTQDYPDVLEDWDIEVEHATQTIWNSVKEGKLKLRKLSNPIRATYHDPCHLGRYSEVYEPPRQIIKSLNYDLVEMKFSKEKAFCCGGGGGVRANYPELAEEIAKERVDQALKTKAQLLITSCPLCYVCLGETGRKPRIETVELSSILVNSIS